MKNKEEITKHVRKKWDQNQWRTEVDSKKSLQEKRTGCTGGHDNTLASVFLFQVRSNVLCLEDRGTHVGEETLCHLCQKERENQVHFILKCEKLNETREATPPYIHKRG